MPWAMSLSAIWPLAVSRRIFSAAETAASAAAARTSANACASAWPILISASLVRRATNSSIFALRIALLALVRGEQFAGFVAQAAGLVEFALDAGATVVERLDHVFVGA